MTCSPDCSTAHCPDCPTATTVTRTATASCCSSGGGGSCSRADGVMESSSSGDNLSAICHVCSAAFHDNLALKEHVTRGAAVRQRGAATHDNLALKELAVV